ncbi:response regulator transcription factor [Dokdonella koreensis]|uniref:Dna binding response regulator PrrA (RegA) n=1 Tax=Dokdonella koreensis DS-123 TaxID=1300342 RepID=A0A160DVX2_9GAMM|nr:response regulator [Dokdonella koreensis]ANB18311.1 Dna binding response regulator PrrA (RegA) [Dokdonella koreensis DS-123]
MKRGLLVDDDALYLRALQRSLERRGLEVAVATTGVAALACARRLQPDFALVDLKLDGETGLDLIAPLRALRSDMRVILVTGYASVATAVEAIKRGADNYLPKPATVPMILRVLRGEPLPAPEVGVQMTPLNRLEWEHIQQALASTAGNISAAARMLGMHRRSLQRKLAKRPARERTPADELD